MLYHHLPTRLSTKLCFRSTCLTNGGGQPVRDVALPEVRRGFWRRPWDRTLLDLREAQELRWERDGRDWRRESE